LPSIAKAAQGKGSASACEVRGLQGINNSLGKGILDSKP
jgi:hypothetical protein